MYQKFFLESLPMCMQFLVLKNSIMTIFTLVGDKLGDVYSYGSRSIGMYKCVL